MGPVMATAPQLTYPHITHDPEVRAGKACIEGTRLAVVDIVLLHKRGYAPEEMQTRPSSGWSLSALRRLPRLAVPGHNGARTGRFRLWSSCRGIGRRRGQRHG
jgi:hypothetical protein